MLHLKVGGGGGGGGGEREGVITQIAETSQTQIHGFHLKVREGGGGKKGVIIQNWYT